MRILGSDLKKVIMNTCFVAAPVMVFILCFTSNVYTDMSRDRVYTVFESLVDLDRDLIKDNSSFASIKVISIVFSGYMAMFMPIIAAFPFIMSFCTERSSGLMRLEMARCGKWRYYLSKFAAALISGGLVVVIGIVMFSIAAAMLFPSLSSYGLSDSEIRMMLPEGEKMTFTRTMISAFVYGSLSTLPAFLVSSVSRNPYLITSIPFMLDFIRDTGIKKAVSAGVEKGDMSVLSRYNPLSSNAITYLIPSGLPVEMIRRTIIISLLSIAAAFLGFVLFMEARADKGV